MYICIYIYILRKLSLPHTRSTYGPQCLVSQRQPKIAIAYSDEAQRIPIYIYIYVYICIYIYICKAQCIPM